MESRYPDEDMLYTAYCSRDRRFDGRFFVGVSSTGIYCRPICPARTPRREHCTFYSTAAAAEAAAYRPCLRCRPEYAPPVGSGEAVETQCGHSPPAPCDASTRLASVAAAWLDANPNADLPLEAVAARFGVSDRHLRRVFQRMYGVTPVAYRQTRRLLLARQLLKETPATVAEVAMHAGFGSVRRMNALFKSRYGASPATLRTQAPLSAATGMSFLLAYRPPLDWAALLGFFQTRAITGVEEVLVAEGVYRRTLAISTPVMVHRGWVVAQHIPDRCAIRVTLSPSLTGCIPQVLARCRSLFDCTCSPDQVARVLGALAEDAPGLRVPGTVDGFETALRAVLGQQVTVAAARTILTRVAAALGAPVETPYAQLTHCMPDAAAILAATTDRLGELGVLRKRTACLQAIAAASQEEPLLLEPGPDVAAQISRLLAIPGIGPWTANYIAMRALDWPDALPAADAGLRAALQVKDAHTIEALAEQWRPWRSYAVMHLWRWAQEGRVWSAT